MSHTAFELEVTLRDIEPPIRRTIEVAGASTLEDLHYAIQVAMGWTNSHLHQFTIGERVFSMAGTEEFGEEFEDERQHRLQDLVRTGDSFRYEYDFGDGWEHDVAVRKVSTVGKPPQPRCIDGARACPPEDCGGPDGYQELLAVLANPAHEEHAEAVAWAGKLRPEHFALPAKGRALRAQMDALRDLAEEADDLPDPGDLPSLPRPLVEAVMALDPIQRAALVALIAASLADEIDELRSIADRLASEPRARPSSPRAVRKGRHR
jgi:hypothetical protein